MTKEEFIKKAFDKHGNKYDYSLVPDVVKYNDKITLICNEMHPWGEPHGCFTVQVGKFLSRGDGCTKCSGKYKRNKEDFIKEATYIHNGLYTYDDFEWVNVNTKGKIHCNKHNIDFFMTPTHHLEGQGCPKCRYEKASKSKTKTTKEFIEKAKEIHGDKYDYSKVNYVNGNEKVCIICPNHGEFWQTPYNHTNIFLQEGCPKCGRENTTNAHKYTQEKFISICKNVHQDTYDYSKTKYVNSHTLITIICPKHGEFVQQPSNHLFGQGCPKCSCFRSKGERDIEEFIKGLGFDVVTTDRTTLCGDEIDILVPSKKIAFEYNGLHWHSDLFKDKNYHLNKTETSANKGIQLVHIFEDEWLNKENIVKSRIRHLLGCCKNRIYARKCEFKEISSKDANLFLEENHIQGKCNGKIRYGLFYNDELVSIMTFGKFRKSLGSKSSENKYELLRFCNKINTNVIGGASKLFNHFIKEINPSEVISYADRRWSIGNLYEKLNFKLDHISKPNYFYLVNNSRKNRFSFRKDLLVKDGFDSNKSEKQIMEERGIPRIYDCGCLCYRYVNNN